LRERERRSTAGGRLVRLAAAICALPLLSGWMVSGTRIDTRFYPISGRSLAELASSVRQHGPMGSYGMGVIDFYPRFQTRLEGGTCRIASAATGLAISLHLPQWKGPDDAPRSVRRVAGRFERAIRRHELQHVAIAKRYTALMTAGLKKLKPEASCWSLRSKAAELIAALKKRHLAAQRGFDRRSRMQIRRLL
jgi:predicted secreted Zn-dependent protease